MKKVCPKCGTTDYIILKGKNSDNVTVCEHFLCSCLIFESTKKLRKNNFLMKIKKYLYNLLKNV